MGEALPEDTWSKEFQTANARPLLSSLQHRLQASTTHIHALAELYRERALIEQDYAAKLVKLTKSAEAGQLLGKNGTPWDRNGGEGKLWDAVLSDIQETASAHSTLASTLKSDFEGPIRDLPNKVVAWRRIHDQESSLDRALKEHDKVSTKLDKAMGKKSNKANELQAELVQVDSSIASLTPIVYSTFQRLDEERLRGLKEACVRWATARADMASRDGARAEQAAARILSWEPQDEVVAVGLRMAQAAGARSSSRAPPPSSTPPQSTTLDRRTSVQTTGTGTSDFTPRVVKANGSSSNVSTHGGGGGGAFGGFKSMLSRKATSAGRQRSGSEATSVRSARRPTAESGSEPVGEGPPERQLSTPVREMPEPIPEKPTRLREPSTTQRAQAPQVDAEGYTIAPADRHRNPWDEPNDPSSLGLSSAGAGAAAGAAAVALPSAIFAGQRSASPAQLQDNQSIGGSSIGDSAPRLNLALAPTPIQESDEERTAALAKMQQTLSMTPQPPTRRSTIARGRREARHTMQTSAAEGGPVPAVHMAALARMGEEERLVDESTLGPRPDLARRRSASSVSSRNPFDSPGLGPPSPGGLGSTTPVLERRPSRGGQPRSPHVAPSPTGASGGAAVGAGAALGAGTAVGAGAAAVAATAHHPDTNGTLFAAAAPSPPPPAPVALAHNQTPSFATSSFAIPGLRASITETVHALIRQNRIQRTTVNGEIRLSLAATPSQPLPPPGSAIHIRLTEFDALESIAPNPAYLAQVPDAPGEYYLDTDKTALATAQPEDAAGAQGPLLFQYSVLVPEGSEGAVAPVFINPAFQVKNGETRMILHYKVTPNSGIADLNLSVVFPSQPEVTTTQSKPVTGTWADTPDGNRAILYKVAPQEGVDNKIIARFLTGDPAPLTPSIIDAHFACPGRILSGIGIETVEGGQAAPGWAFADIHRAVVSGKYAGEPSVN